MLCTRTDTPGTPEYQCSFDFTTDCPVRDTVRPHLWPGTLGQDGPVCMRNSPATGIEFVYSDGSALPLTCTSGGHGQMRACCFGDADACSDRFFFNATVWSPDDDDVVMVSSCQEDRLRTLMGAQHRVSNGVGTEDDSRELEKGCDGRVQDYGKFIMPKLTVQPRDVPTPPEFCRALTGSLDTKICEDAHFRACNREACNRLRQGDRGFGGH